MVDEPAVHQKECGTSSAPLIDDSGSVAGNNSPPVGVLHESALPLSHQPGSGGRLRLAQMRAAHAEPGSSVVPADAGATVEERDSCLTLQCARTDIASARSLREQRLVAETRYHLRISNG